MEQFGKSVIIIGLLISIAGMVIWLAGNKLSWLGHLPGDFRIVKKGFTLFIPFTSMLLVSVLISFLIWLIKKLPGQ